VIKYIGSKRTLVPLIVQLVGGLGQVRTVADLFTGTTRVAQAFKGQGLHVVSNDMASYAHVLGQAYIEADARELDLPRIERQLGELAALPPSPGYFTETFCERSRFIHPLNGARIDAMRPAIDALAHNELERAVLLTSLLEAADRVDSTTGLQMAYLKQWAPRAHKPLELRMPALLAGCGRALQGDANALVRTLEHVDVAYLDPPYNQHSYHSNYHVWETLVRWDAPEVYGIACKRLDCRTTKSRYNSRPRAAAALADLLANLDARTVVVSFSDEGFVHRDEITAMLEPWGEVAVLPVGSRRYIGARIGIHDPAGRKVGRVSHVRNTEYLFVAGVGAQDAVHSCRSGLAAPPRARGGDRAPVVTAPPD